MTRRYIIYVLREPDTKKVRYVGCTRCPKLRRQAHRTVKSTPRSPVELWVAKLAEFGLKPEFRIIAKFKGPEIIAPNGKNFRPDVFARMTEEMVIQKLRNCGCQLLNADMDEVRRRARYTQPLNQELVNHIINSNKLEQ